MDSSVQNVPARATHHARRTLSGSTPFWSWRRWPGRNYCLRITTSYIDSTVAGVGRPAAHNDGGAR